MLTSPAGILKPRRDPVRAGFPSPAAVVRFVTRMTGMTTSTIPALRLMLISTLIFSTVAAACSPVSGEPAEPGSAASSAHHTVAAAAVQRDSILLAAERAIGEGRPWRATELLASSLRDDSSRSSAAVLLAARAAAAWGGWSEVERLLAGERWIDSEADGRGRVLLVNAALARNADSLAAAHAVLALASARNDRERGTRLVLLARALDRMEQRDSAAATYARAAALHPEAADWLRLRAAGITADSVQRARHLAAVRTDVARARAGLTDAIARERTGDIAGAIQAYSAIGSRVAALRLRTVVAADSTERRAIRSELVSIASAAPGSADARTAVEILDASYAPLTPAEELVVARALVSGGPAARVTAAYGRALGAGLGTSTDRYRYAMALAGSGRGREALPHFARVPAPASLAAAAAYQRARTMLQMGDVAAARTALRAIPGAFPDDTSSATALYLLADLATDEQRDEPARATFLSLARRYPTSPRAAPARFRAATIAYVQGQFRTAALELDSLRSLYPRSSEAPAAGYWSARAWARAGDTTRARERWEAVLASDPLSYYGATSAARLNRPVWAPPAASDSFARFPALDSALARIAVLHVLGFDFERRLELDRLSSDAGNSAERLLATADAFRRIGEPMRGIQLTNRAVAAGAPRDARTYRLLYPVVHRELLAHESKAHGLDPALVAALIRQESMFNARATSPAGARGLMQVMPSVGQQIARSLNFPVWDPVLLYQADVNARLGTQHLAGLFRQYSELAHVLAAYNAGGSRVTRWRNKAGAGDAEMFIERIPFVETRDYVRILLRNRELYRALYAW